MTICRQCKREFVPARPMMAVCSPRCAIRHTKAAMTAKKAIERAQTRARREAVKTISDRIRLAQNEFNKFIRMRDRLAGHPCISSG